MVHDGFLVSPVQIVVLVLTELKSKLLGLEPTLCLHVVVFKPTHLELILGLLSLQFADSSNLLRASRVIEHLWDRSTPVLGLLIGKGEGRWQLGFRHLVIDPLAEQFHIILALERVLVR